MTEELSPLNVRHDNDRIDRDALLALAEEMEEFGNLPVKHPGIRVLHNDDFSRELGYARRIREALRAQASAPATRREPEA